MKLYRKDGYLNIEGLLRQPFTFIFLIGGRGTGKTYGILKYIVENRKTMFMIRRTQAQADIVSKPEFNPFRPITDGVIVKPESKYHSGFYKNDNCVGYIAGLSTFAKIRGFDASGIDIIFYDEFIPELHEARIRHEAEALLNAYETVNRNRELSGKDPVKLVCAANSNRIDNEVLQKFGLLNPLQKMIKTGTEIWKDEKRSILLVYLSESPISKAKEKTALYTALGEESHYADMALKNRFAELPDSIVSRDLSQYRILLKIGNIGFYVARSGNLGFYVRRSKETAAREYGTEEAEVRRFRYENPFIWKWVTAGIVEFESLDVFTEFNSYLT